LARPKGLVLTNIVWGELFLKFYFKKIKKLKKSPGEVTRGQWRGTVWGGVGIPLFSFLQEPHLPSAYLTCAYCKEEVSETHSFILFFWGGLEIRFSDRIRFNTLLVNAYDSDW
jgi:hypothetical protein